jgi:hypothetical protein
VSGNPEGRPAIAKLVRDLCRENNVGRIEDVVAEIYRIALHGKGMIKLEALKYLCDRVAGKPSQSVTGDDGGPLKVDFVGIAEKFRKLANG